MSEPHSARNVRPAGLHSVGLQKPAPGTPRQLKADTFWRSLVVDPLPVCPPTSSTTFTRAGLATSVRAGWMRAEGPAGDADLDFEVTRIAASLGTTAEEAFPSSQSAVDARTPRPVTHGGDQSLSSKSTGTYNPYNERVIHRRIHNIVAKAMEEPGLQTRAMAMALRNPGLHAQEEGADEDVEKDAFATAHPEETQSSFDSSVGHPRAFAVLWGARHRPNLPTSKAATDEKPESYQNLHRSHVEMKALRRKHVRDETMIPGQTHPEVAPMLSSQVVGWHTRQHPPRPPAYPHCKSDMSHFFSAMAQGRPDPGNQLFDTQR